MAEGFLEPQVEPLELPRRENSELITAFNARFDCCIQIAVLYLAHIAFDTTTPFLKRARLHARSAVAVSVLHGGDEALSTPNLHTGRCNESRGENVSFQEGQDGGRSILAATLGVGVPSVSRYRPSHVPCVRFREVVAVGARHLNYESLCASPCD